MPHLQRGAFFDKPEVTIDSPRCLLGNCGGGFPPKTSPSGVGSFGDRDLTITEKGEQHEIYLVHKQSHGRKGGDSMQVTVKEVAGMVGLTPCAIHQQYHRGQSFGSLFSKVAGVLIADKGDIEYMLSMRPASVSRDHYIKIPVSGEEKAKIELEKGDMPMTEYLRSKVIG